MARRRRKQPPLTNNGHGALCHYCRRQLEGTTSSSTVRATRDHVFPASRGGTYRVWACFTCNNLKGDMTPLEWAKWRLMNPGWWKVRT